MKTQEKVLRIGLVREKGYLYYLDKGGDISRAPMFNVTPVNKTEDKKSGKVMKLKIKQKKGGYIFWTVKVIFPVCLKMCTTFYKNALINL